LKRDAAIFTSGAPALHILTKRWQQCVEEKQCGCASLVFCVVRLERSVPWQICNGTVLIKTRVAQPVSELGKQRPQF